MKNWVHLAHKNFDKYYHSFTDLSEEQKNNFSIKHKHSIRVAGICSQIASKIDLSPNEKHLATIIGLFHDIGRFRQLLEFNTFNDAKSVDHAAYSIKVLKEENLLHGLNNTLTETILIAIEHHNKRKIPDRITGENLLFSQLIRDADKLDILKVITDYYIDTNSAPNHTLTWEMPVGTNVSAEVKEQILKGEQVSRENIKNSLDIKVMQLSWVFDFNFKPSLEILKQKKFLEKIYSTMPKDDLTQEIYNMVKNYVGN